MPEPAGEGRDGGPGRVRRPDRRRQEALQRAADRACALILIEDFPEVDIEIEIARVRDLCAELFPDRLDLFELVYGSRFRRLREQFRPEE